LVKKAIIPAAGYGTRGLPITKVLPKEMLPICGRPAIDFLVEEAIKAGIEQILIVVSKSKNMILDYYDRCLELEVQLQKQNKLDLLEKLDIPNVHIQYVRQTYASGLGHAILLGRQFVGDEPFAVMLPDEIILSESQVPLKQLINMYNNYGGNILGVKTVNSKDLKNYGVIKHENLGVGRYKITDIVEKPKHNPPSNLAVIGRYILEPNIFNYLTNIEPGVGGELQLTDAIKKMLQDYPSFGLEIVGQRFDIANMSEYVKLINLVYDSYQKDVNSDNS
jgi:UTP--glucose-1-phosphate uridylyltransferase